MVDIRRIVRVLASAKVAPLFQAELCDVLEKVLPAGGINTPLRVCHFLAQASHESAGFSAMSENLNYSADALRKSWPKRFPDVATAQKYQRNPAAIANRAYADRLGNGPEASGDGWKYRGRGIFQLTGKANYESFGEKVGLDLVGQPELAAAPDAAARVAVAFWNDRDLSEQADHDNIRNITHAINGGFNGLDDRMARLRKAKFALGLK